VCKDRANGKSYAVSIVIGWRAAFMRARSGTRTFSCVIFFRALLSSNQKNRGCHTPATPHRSILELTSARITRSPGPCRIQARADKPNVLSTPSRREKFFLDGLIQLYRESGRPRKEERFSWWLAECWRLLGALPACACRRARRSGTRARPVEGRACGPGNRESWSRASRRRR